MARRIDLTQRFVNADDTIAKDKDNQPITLKQLLIQSCLNEITGFGPNGQPIPVPGDEKGRRYELYGRLKRAGKFIELDAEDTTFLKRISQCHPTLACGQICDMLEMKKPPKAEPEGDAPDKPE
jgi:hypothetical protein